jgi:predicted transcriptional regulator
MGSFAERLGGSGKVAEVRDERSRAFDIAYAEEKAYLIKVVHNIESISSEQALTISKCASVVGAEPLFLSERGKEPLREDVVYVRHGVPVMREETFMHVVRGHNVSRADRGGIKVPIRGLKPAMRRVGMKRATLAKLLDVSTEMVRKYEKGLADPSEDVAARLLDIFGRDIAGSFHYEPPSMERAFIGKAPFDLALKRHHAVLVSFKSSPERIENLEGVSDVLDAEPVVADSLEDVDLE